VSLSARGLAEDAGGGQGPGRRKVTLHRHRVDSARRRGGPAIGDNQDSRERSPHDRIHHQRAFPADLRLGDRAVVPVGPDLRRRRRSLSPKRRRPRGAGACKDPVNRGASDPQARQSGSAATDRSWATVRPLLTSILLPASSKRSVRPTQCVRTQQRQSWPVSSHTPANPRIEGRGSISERGSALLAGRRRRLVGEL
jgi:hypothetical protein